MGEDKIPRIKEDLKRDILNYLVNGIKEKQAMDYFTYSQIIDYLDEPSEKIDPILKELEEENTIKSIDVSFKIYVPESTIGDEFIVDIKDIAIYSPFWLMVFSLVVFYVSSYYINFKLDENFVGTTLESAYRHGIQYAIIASAIVGSLGGNILQGIGLRLRTMQILSPERYNQMYEVAKNTILISIAIALIYPTAVKKYGIEMTHDAVIIFLSALSLSIAYVSMRSSSGD